MQLSASTRSSSPTKIIRALAPSVVALLLAGAQPVVAQPPPDLHKRLDEIAGAEVRADRSVGIVAMVATDAETLLLGSYGKSDVETDEAMSVDSILAIGSITKQFTAAAVLQLRDRGKLDLDDEVTKWLPDFQAHGNKVTLRHLLGHTSGVADLAAMPELRRLRMMRNPELTRDAIYEIINAHPFQFPTGTMQAYCNTGYWLLGRIIEKVTGAPYEDYVEQELFALHGMKRTRFGSNAEKLPRCAAGHGIRNGTIRRAPRVVHNEPSLQVHCTPPPRIKSCG